MKILAPFISCLIESSFEADGEDEVAQAITDGYQQIYIQTSTGVLKHHRLRPGKDGVERYVRVPVSEIPGLKARVIGPDIKFFPDGKIPMVLLETVKQFFRDVIKCKGSAVEAMIWVLWSQERGYFLHVPNQVVSHASAQYDWSTLPAGSSIIVDIHSHADFNAFFSGTDNTDDSNTIRFSGVIGHNNRPEPSTKWRFNYFGMKIEVEDSDIFEREQPEITETPTEWLDAVEIRTYAGKGQKIRMDGSISEATHGRYNPHALYPGSGPRYPSAFTERADEESANSPRGKKKHIGEQKTTSLPQNRHNGYYGSSLNPTTGASIHTPHIVSNNGQQFVDTGYGLIPLENRGDVLEEDKAMSRLDAIGQAFGDGVPGRLPVYGEQLEIEALELEALGLTPEGFEGTDVSMVERIEAQARRQAMEDLLSDAADTHLDSQILSHSSEKGQHTSSFSTSADQDRPPEYDEICCNHGVDVANAYTAIEVASTDLVDAMPVLKRAVENLFQLIEDTDKLPLFRSLYDNLPAKAQSSLAQNGF